MISNDHLLVNRIATGNANISAGAGKVFHVVGVHNASLSDETLSFPDDSRLDAFTITAGAHLSLSYPVACKSFTPAADVAVFYYELQG